MKKIVVITSIVMMSLLSVSALAQQTKGTIIAVSGTGEVTAENDQAKASFFIEEQDKDKAVAASRVNQKMKDGTEILKKLDPDGKFATHGYYTYPVYTEPTSSNKSRVLTGWRVGQYLELTTKSIVQLPATVAAVQQVLALNGLNFGLSEEVTKNLEAKRLEAAYKNLHERVQIIAKAMGRDPADSSIEALDFDSSAGHFQPQPRMYAAASMMAKGSAVQETSFEPGETTLTATVVAKIKFN
jgi:uncharacterized protein YggE